MRPYNFLCLLAGALMLPAAGCAQQQPDMDYVPEIDRPLFANGAGPLLLIDEGHHNFHTAGDKFAPFARVATLDGFMVKGLSTAINSGALKDARILVVANALHEANTDSWQQPVQQAFTGDEIKAVQDWVAEGGRLFLIADHMPFAGAASGLAAAFGFGFLDGFAMRRPKRPDIFSFSSGMLHHNTVTDAHGGADSIVTFTGQAFRTPEGATPIITLDSSYTILLPEVAWEFNDKMKMIPGAGLSQLACRQYGKGKVVVSGEAAMFTAQKAGKAKIGINSPEAPNNLRLLRNILEWLNE